MDNTEQALKIIKRILSEGRDQTLVNVLQQLKQVEQLLEPPAETLSIHVTEELSAKDIFGETRR